MFKTINDKGFNDPGLKRYLSPVSVWALSFGCAVGWGSFVMPGTTFLPTGGPLGTVIGMLLGAAVMLIIGVNYHYMMNRYPDSGGTYSYAKNEFGYDHGFLSAWFLILVYVAITWANATALPLIFRNLFGGLFQFGFHYKVAGFDVYFGEVLLSAFAIVFFGLFCIKGGKAAVKLQTLLAFILIGGVLIGFSAAVIGTGGRVFHISPAFVPDKKPIVSIINIVVLAPWAFAGFESVSNSAEEFKFSPKKSLAIMSIAVVTSTVAYVFLALLAVSVLPEGYSDWYSYIQAIGDLSGLEGLPTFHAVNALMGKAGLVILLFTVLAGVITGLIGNYIAAARLIYSLAKDNLLPGWFGELNTSHTPKNAILFLMLISLPIPFLGRTAIGWIVDVNTIGATIAYAYTSATAYKMARDEGSMKLKITGAAGFFISVLFFVYFMIPNFWTVSALSTESYMILIAWSILGFLFFRYIFARDEKHRLGKSTIVWIVLLFLILFTSMLWFRQSTHNLTKNVLEELTEYNRDELSSYGIEMSEEDRIEADQYLENRLDIVNRILTNNSFVQMFLIILSLFIMFNIYNSMMNREKKLEISSVKAEQRSRAKSIFLSNMSHDIRTPMNAIMGYTALAKKVTDNPEETADFLDKIEVSGKHLLALINDVLEMSRIESGKMDLEPVTTDIERTIREAGDLFTTQMIGKSICFSVSCEDVKDRLVMCDRNRLNRVLLNLLSNALKFTPEGGRVSLILRQTGSVENEGVFEIRVEDSGMGMSPEFAEKVFEFYSRERSAENIQGTGLGMAITKSIVDIMGGTISVKTKKGVGTAFIINLTLPVSECDSETVETEKDEKTGDFSGMKVLLVDDNEINREIAMMILQESGFEIMTAENGKDALDIIAESTPGEYRLILMDIQMPVMNGYDATKAIRALDNKELSEIPIVAMTANAFAEDIQEAKDAGMNAHIAKPFDAKKILDTLSGILLN